MEVRNKAKTRDRVRRRVNINLTGTVPNAITTANRALLTSATTVGRPTRLPSFHYIAFIPSAMSLPRSRRTTLLLGLSVLAALVAAHNGSLKQPAEYASGVIRVGYISLISVSKQN